MSIYDFTQGLMAGLFFGGVLGAFFGSLVTNWVLTKGVTWLAEQRLTPAEREIFGGFMLRILGKR